MKQWRVSLILLGLLAGCGEDPLSPTVQVMVGAFGSTAEPIQLLASRAGVEFDGGCSSYFVSREAARIDLDGSFAVRGTLYTGSSSSAHPAILAGVFDRPAGSVDFTLRLASQDPQAVPHQVVHEGQRYTGMIVCPS